MDEKTRREALRELDRSVDEHGFWPDYLEKDHARDVREDFQARTARVGRTSG